MDELISIDAPLKGEDEHTLSGNVKKRVLVKDVKIGTDGRTNVIRIPDDISRAAGIETGQKVRFTVKDKGKIEVKWL